jgi:hypothetical protein
MESISSEFIIVILASANNPSILNPDFLRINDIVDKDFNPIESISTPPVSHVKYKEKVAITVDFERLTFIDTDEDRIPHNSPIPSIAKKYIEILRHVPYKAVGINFNGYYECSHMDPSQYILNKLIKKGPWNEFEGVEPSIGLSFSYKMDEVTLNLNIAPAITRKDERTFPSIAINSNFHCDPQEKKIENIVSYIKSWELQYKQLNDLLSKIFF